MELELSAKLKPAGDQPKAIEQLVAGIRAGNQFQTLLGVTGSGKTFTAANVIAKTKRPTLVIAHNKTLAAQLCNEFRELFPQNVVEYFVSYYDYYQPEAYLPSSDTYIEKESMINNEIDRLRHAATQAILTRRDVIIVASVSCIYGLGEPENYKQAAFPLSMDQTILRANLLESLISLQFTRTNTDPTRGMFRLRGNTLEVMPNNQEVLYRVEFKNETVESMLLLDPVTRKVREKLKQILIFPAKHFVMKPEEIKPALERIRAELKERLAYFNKQGKLLEADRLDRRTRYDLEMIQNVGYCHGIENYSRQLAGRVAGSPPETLLDYFNMAYSKEWLLVVDESHVTMPQISGMYEGDRSRKNTLIEHGFRLPSAADNRPLKFNEFETRIPQTIFMSATPSQLERTKSSQIVEQIIRPTGLVDPEIIVRPVTAKEKKNPSQVDDVMQEIKIRAKKKERVLVTTLTKKMAEDLSEYLETEKIKAKYLHSEVDTLDRITILTDFRKGVFDVLVGVNLLREGLDLPEVTLVAILDADKEGFLRSDTALIQTIGRAARNVNGKVILYADTITDSMKRAMDETERRREHQLAYNKEHGITPKTIKKKIHDITEGLTRKKSQEQVKAILEMEAVVKSGRLEDVINDKERQMKSAAKDLQFELAAILRDEIVVLRKQLRAGGKKVFYSTGSRRG